MDPFLIDLSLPDLLTLCEVNKEFNLYCMNDTVWKLRLIKEFPNYKDLIKPEDISWRDYYLYLTSTYNKTNIYENNEYKGYFYLPNVSLQNLKLNSDDLIIYVRT